MRMGAAVIIPPPHSFFVPRKTAVSGHSMPHFCLSQSGNSAATAKKYPARKKRSNYISYVVKTSRTFEQVVVYCLAPRTRQIFYSVHRTSWVFEIDAHYFDIFCALFSEASTRFIPRKTEFLAEKVPDSEKFDGTFFIRLTDWLNFWANRRLLPCSKNTADYLRRSPD